MSDSQETRQVRGRGRGSSLSLSRLLSRRCRCYHPQLCLADPTGSPGLPTCSCCACDERRAIGELVLRLQLNCQACDKGANLRDEGGRRELLAGVCRLYPSSGLLYLLVGFPQSCRQRSDVDRLRDVLLAMNLPEVSQFPPSSHQLHSVNSVSC